MMKNKTNIPTILIGALLLFVNTALFANSERNHSTNAAHTSNKSANEIIEEVDQRGRGYQDLVANLEMTITDQKKRQHTRSLQIRMLEDPSDRREDKSALVFLSPADQRGVSLLTHTHASKADEQWLYLPALKRVKKISYRSSGSPFMGSDFTYEDLAPINLTDFDYQMVPECGQHKLCIAQTNKPEGSSNNAQISHYAKRILWIDDQYRIFQIDFFDQHQTLTKRLVINRFENFAANRWRPTDMEMTTFDTGTTTRLAWQDFQTQVGLNDSHFTTLSIKRLR